MYAAHAAISNAATETSAISIRRPSIRLPHNVTAVRLDPHQSIGGISADRNDFPFIWKNSIITPYINKEENDSPRVFQNGMNAVCIFTSSMSAAALIH